MSTRVRTIRWGALAAIAFLVGSTVSVGATQSDADLRAERDRIRAERAETAGNVDVASAELGDLNAALADLEANVRAEEAQLDDAQRAVAVADEQVAEALAAQAAAQAEVEELRESMARMAVDAYVSPPDQDNLSVMLTGELGTAPERQALLEMSATNRADLLEQFRAALEDLEIQSQTATDAQRRAEESRLEVERRLSSVAEARDAQAVVAAQAQQRLYQLREQAAALEADETSITNELAERERQRLAELERQLAQASAQRGPVSVPGQGTIQLTTVGGITVNSSIAGPLQQMLSHAASDGIILTGGGYRDSAQQIALRRAHCGSSNYAIYEMPAGQCSPPTARPGSSLHEQGLAIDFSANGSSITSRSHPGFVWLAQNAASYGFYNLPSEPWHWSTTGG
ncbi:MAG: D-alanyl-D-alanine carboxypeptidase family protein [Acidimicrobiales bacterium]